MRAAVCGALASLLVAAVALAGEDPNQVRGIAPGNVYRNFDIDTVNQFNGNLVVRIPLGDALPVGPLLSQKLYLVHNSKVYDFLPEQYRNHPEDTLSKRVAVPERFSNAGLGWTVTMGVLVPPDVPTAARGWFYRSPDGSEHDFTEDVDDPPVAETRDGSYLRMKRYPSNLSLPATAREIEFPDGTVHRFEPSGNVREIRDSLGHWIRVDDSDPLRWVITSGYQQQTMRTAYVNFTNRTAPAGQYQPNFQRVVSSVELPAFGTGTPAVYRFTHTDTVLPRDGCGDWIIDSPTHFAAPLLTEIRFPDNSTYTLRYQDKLAYACSAGLITGITLPTRGSIEWTHQDYLMSQQECDDAHGWVVATPGVHKRIQKDEQGNVVGEWTHVPSIDLNPGTPTQCGAFDGENYNWGPAPTEATTTVSVAEMRNGVLTPVDGKTVHYFSATLNLKRATALGHRIQEYGLPFTRRVSDLGDPTRFLSTRRYDESNSLVRSSYLSYAYDAQYFDQKVANARVRGELTVFHTDTGCGGMACRVDVDRPEGDYAGYGHYRKSVSTSNFGPTRTSFTNYTPNPATWILGTYDSSWTEEGGVASKEWFSFDANGFLRTKRTLVGRASSAAAIQPHPQRDVLTAYCRDGRGFLQSERFFGGDNPNAYIPSGDPCGVAPEYQIDHAYTFHSSSGAPIRHTARYSGMPFFITDQDFDANTGLVSASRDVSGVQTDYKYDAIGRPVEVRPAGMPWSRYEYFNATPAAPATLRMTTRAAGTTSSATPLTDAYVYYDWYGRPVQEKRKVPSDSGSRWSTSRLVYDALGRKTRVSVPEFRDTQSYEPSFAPAKWTSTTYDMFGRPLAITAPDDKVSTLAYPGKGVREVRRTVEIGLATGPENVTTIETMDAQGRLVQVTEGNGVVTRYQYDITGGLADVCQNTTNGGATCGQRRTFTFDNRGFLTSENHPESGTTNYTYDSRGHVLSKSIPGTSAVEANLQYVYDSAERLTEVRTKHPTLNVFRPGKLFTFGTANDGTNRKLGKMTSATRYNYGAGEVMVKETYDYADTAGRLTKTTTEIVKDGTLLQTLQQAQSYEAGGNIGTMTYPTCITVGCGAATWNTSTLTYTNGFLTQVNRFADAITYTAAGAVSQVDHGIVTDTYTPDVTGQRLHSITFSGQTECAAPVIAAGTPEDESVGSGQPAVLTVSATGATGYQWFEGNGTKIAGQTGSSFTTPPVTSSRSYYVEVYNDCQKLRSRTVAVSLCSAVSIASGSPQDQSVQPERTATLTVSAPGATAFQWYESNGTLIPGQTAATFTTPQLSGTKSYYVVASNGCNSVQSRVVTVTVLPLAAPAGLRATAASTTAVDIVWNASANAHHYVLERTSGNATSQRSVSGTSIRENVSPGATFLYRVRAVSENELVTSSLSNADLATTISFAPLVRNQTRMAATHLDEVLAAINGVRAVHGAPAVAWASILPAGVAAPGSGVRIQAQHILSLRSAMNAARAALGLSGVGYADPALSGFPFRIEHITEVRGGAQ